MANYFDRFDAIEAKSPNYFDRFDEREEEKKVDPTYTPQQIERIAQEQADDREVLRANNRKADERAINALADEIYAKRNAEATPSGVTDRAYSYMDQGLISRWDDALANAEFDKRLQDTLNKRMAERPADPISGEKIQQSYRPDQEAQRVEAQKAELDYARAITKSRADAQRDENWWRDASDFGLDLQQGAVNSFAALSSLAGADNGTATRLRALSDWLGEFKTDKAKAEAFLSAKRIAEAEAKGDWKTEVGAYMDMIADAPDAMLAQAVGSFATLGLGKAAQMAKIALAARGAGMSAKAFVATEAGQKAAQAALQLGARTNIAVSAAQGTGSVKSAQYEQTYRSAKQAGMSDEEANRLASEAQAYGGPGTVDQLIGAALGGVAAATGSIEKAILAGRASTAGLRMGAPAALVKGFAIDGGTEALQGGQEKLAGNTAAIGAGVMDEGQRYRGVAGSAVTEGLMGGVLGGGVNVATDSNFRLTGDTAAGYQARVLADALNGGTFDPVTADSGVISVSAMSQRDAQIAKLAREREMLTQERGAAQAKSQDVSGIMSSGSVVEAIAQAKAMTDAGSDVSKIDQDLQELTNNLLELEGSVADPMRLQKQLDSYVQSVLATGDKADTGAVAPLATAGATTTAAGVGGTDAIDTAGQPKPEPALTVQKNPSGTVTVLGNIETAQRVLREAGVTQVIPTKGGLMVSTLQAERAAGAIEAAAQVSAEPAAPDVEAAGVEPVSQSAQPKLDVTGRPPASWVVRNKETGEVLFETFDQAKVQALNTAKYEAVPIGKHLAGLNKPTQQQQAKAPQHLGVDNVPLAEGGKPFKTKDVAAKAKKLQPMMRVVKVEGGFALAEKTPAQLAAQGKAAKRLGGVGGAGPLSAHAFIASNGGLNKAVASDLGIDGNVRVGGRWLYSSAGGMTLEQATEKLLAEGYIDTDDQNAALNIIKRSVQTPQYTPAGWEQIAQAESQARFEDHLAAQQEAMADDEDFDPFPSLESSGFAAEDTADAGFDEASPDLMLEVAASTTYLSSIGGDPDSVIERIALQYPNATQEEFHEYVKAALTEALTKATQPRGNRDSGQDDGEQGQARWQAQVQSGNATTEGLDANKQGDEDWMTALFGDSPSEGSVPTSSSVRGRADLTTLSAKLRDFSKMKLDEANDWASRQYKDNRTKINFEGDGPTRNESISVSRANEARRERNVQALQQQAQMASNLANRIERGRDVNAEIEQAISDAERGLGPAIGQTVEDRIEGYISNALLGDENYAYGKGSLARVILQTYRQGGVQSDNGRQGAPGTDSEQGLTAYTPEELEARQDRAESAQREKEAADRAAQRQADQDEERKRIAQASVAAADTFELGQDPLDSLTGQRDIFGAAPEPEAQADDGITIKPGKGLIKGKFLSEVDGDGVPGGPWDTEAQARTAAEAWKQTKSDRATENAAERARRDRIAEKFRNGEGVTNAEIESLGLKTGTSDMRWFMSTAANLFGLDSRDIRPIVKNMIRTSLTDMGAKREFVPTRQALEAVAQRANFLAASAQADDAPMFSRAKAKEIRNLVTLHNLTEENLGYADSMGAIPVPSLGITKVDAPFSGFGNITLVGDKNLVDPGQGVPVYDRDAWTARFPSMNYKKVKAAKADAFYERMKPAKEMAEDGGQFLSMLWEEVRNSNSQRPEKVADLFTRYDAPKVYYLRNVLEKNFKVPMRDYKPSVELAADSKVMAYYKAKRAAVEGFDSVSAEDHAKALREFEALVSDAVDRVAAKAGDRAELRARMMRQAYFEDDGRLGGNTLRAIFRDIQKVGTKVVDGVKMMEAINKAVPRNDPAYLKWVQNQVKPLFDAPTITLRGKEVEPTLDNIVEAMTVGATAGVEKSMTFGPGKLAAHLGKRFKSLDEIKAARDQVVSESVESEAKKATDAILEEFRTHAGQFFTVKDWRGNIDTWAANDSSMEALAKAGKFGLSDGAIRASLQSKGFKGVDQRTIDLARQAIEALRDTATNYFEAKPQRAVKLNEFKGAVVPKDISPESLAILEKNGITVEFYGKAEGAREKAIEKLAKRLDRQSGDVLFSERSQPVLGTPATQIRQAIKSAYGSMILPQLEANGLLDLTQTIEQAVDAAAKARAAKTGGDVEAIKRGLMASVQNSIRAWHGSPHRGITKFSTDKIGTGEGAQAYGWGLYFASKRDIAEYYRNALSAKELDYSIAGKKFEDLPWLRNSGIELGWLKNWVLDNIAAGRAVAGDGTNDSATDKIVSLMSRAKREGNAKKASALEQLLALVESGKVQAEYRKGQLYEVEIPEDSEMLLWDKPLSEQPSTVQDAVDDAIRTAPGADETIIARYESQAMGMTGEEIYKLLAGRQLELYGQRGASEHLASHGIKGIKYLDGTSRADGDGSYNYVIFSGDDVEIVDVKYSANGDVQGFFDPVSGKAFMVADNLTAETAPGVLLHEVGIHMAADKALQPLFERAAFLIQAGRGNPFFDAVRKRMEDAGETSPEEAAAYLAEAYENDRVRGNMVERWLKDIASAIRVWLFNKGVLIAADDLKPADIATIARANVRKAAKPSRTDGAGVKYSRTQRQTEALREMMAAENALEVVRSGDPNRVTLDQWMALSERSLKAKKGLTAELTKIPDDGFVLQAAASNGRMVMLTPSAQQPGKWQLTRFDSNGEPWGDTNYGTKEQAIREFIEEADLSTLTSGEGASFSRISQDQTQSEAFKRWFGNSAVVDADGKPLVVYHGTNADFSVFRPGRNGNAIFVAFDPASAEKFGQRNVSYEGGQLSVMPVYVKAENPFDYQDPAHVNALVRELDKETDSWGRRMGEKRRGQIAAGDWEVLEAPMLQAAIRRLGHDGYYVQEAGQKNLAVYSPEQIKSAIGNNGQFDPANPDIRFSRKSPSAVWAGDEPVAIVNRINGKIAGLGAKVTSVATFADLPQHVQDAANDAGVAPGEFRGVTMAKGQVFVVHGNHSSAADLEATIIHEVYGHVGLRALFGPDLYRRLNKLYLNLGDVRVRELADRYGLSANGYLEMADNLALTNPKVLRAGGTVEAKQGWIMEELLAHIAERETGTLKQLALEVIGGVKNWLRENGFVRLAQMDMADIAYILKQGRVAAETATDFAGEPDAPMFRRQSAAGSQPAWTAPESTRTDKVIYELQDSRVDLKRVQQAIEKATGQLDEQFDARLSETLYMGRVAKRTDDFLKLEAKPLLESMAKGDVSQAELSDYLLARGAPERNAQIAKINPDLPDGGAGTNSEGVLMTTQAALDYVAALSPARKQMLDSLAAQVDAITKGTRDLLVSEGLEKAETIAAWEAAYPNYVPMFKDEAQSGVPHPQGSGFSVTGGASRRATGSTKEVTNMLAHVLMQREAALTRAEKNRVGLSLYGLALSSPNQAFWTTVRPNMSDADIEDSLMAIGVDPAAMGDMSKAPTVRTVDKRTGMVVDRPNPLYAKMDNALVVKVNGENRVILFNETNERAMRLVGSLKNLDGLTKLDLAGSLVGKTTRFMASMSTQYNPAFGMVNFLRDVQGALVNLSTTEIAGKQLEVMGHVPAALKGIARALQDGGQSNTWSALFDEFQRAGGQTGYRDMLKSANERASLLEKELGLAKDNGRLTVGKVSHGVLDVLDGFNTTLENGVRLAAYKVARDQGLSPAKAARLARELTVDFNRKGRAGRELGPLYAFFNAAVQGSERTIRTVAKNPGKVLTGGLALGVLQALMLAAAGFEDDEIPEFEKARSLIIPTGDKKYVKIPLALGLHVIPNAGRTITELLMSGGTDLGEKSVNALGELLGSFNPLGGGNVFTAHGLATTIAPTVVDPLLDLGFDKNFAGNSISKFRYPGDARPGYSVSKESTQRSFMGREVYTGIAKAINYASGGDAYEQGLASPTPEQVRYVFGAIGGGLYREIEKTLNAAEAMATGKEMKASDVPYGSRFAGEVNMADVERGRYFKNVERISDVRAQVKAAANAGDDEAIERLANKRPAEFAMADYLGKIQYDLSQLNGLANERIGDVEGLKEVDAAREELMSRLNQTMKELELEAAGDFEIDK